MAAPHPKEGADMDVNSVIALGLVLLVAIFLITLSTRRLRAAGRGGPGGKNLPESERRRFAEAWRSTQTDFVDHPEAAVTNAVRLVEELIQARGYLTGGSIASPRIVESYRAVRAVARLNARGEATIEELREAMMHCRSLFGDLLEAPLPQAAERRVDRGTVFPGATGAAGARR